MQPARESNLRSRCWRRRVGLGKLDLISQPAAPLLDRLGALSACSKCIRDWPGLRADPSSVDISRTATHDDDNFASLGSRRCSMQAVMGRSRRKIGGSRPRSVWGRVQLDLALEGRRSGFHSLFCRSSTSANVGAGGTHLRPPPPDSKPGAPSSARRPLPWNRPVTRNCQVAEAESFAMALLPMSTSRAVVVFCPPRVTRGPLCV